MIFLFLFLNKNGHHLHTKYPLIDAPLGWVVGKHQGYIAKKEYLKEKSFAANDLCVTRYSFWFLSSSIFMLWNVCTICPLKAAIGKWAPENHKIDDKSRLTLSSQTPWLIKFASVSISLYKAQSLHLEKIESSVTLLMYIRDRGRCCTFETNVVAESYAPF